MSFLSNNWWVLTSNIKSQPQPQGIASSSAAERPRQRKLGNHLLPWLPIRNPQCKYYWITCTYMAVSENSGSPQNGWLIMENPVKMDDLGVPLFLETPIYVHTVDGWEILPVDRGWKSDNPTIYVVVFTSQRWLALGFQDFFHQQQCVGIRRIQWFIFQRPFRRLAMDLLSRPGIWKSMERWCNIGLVLDHWIICSPPKKKHVLWGINTYHFHNRQKYEFDAKQLKMAPGWQALQHYCWMVQKSQTTTWHVWNPVHPGRLTWNIIIGVWKIIFLSKWVIGMFHVNLPGCK